jgi:hypothetical protein
VCSRMPFKVLTALILLLVGPIAAGCEAPRQLPDFLARSEEDCLRGDQLACSTVDIFRAPRIRAAEPLPLEVHPTQVRHDV